MGVAFDGVGDYLIHTTPLVLTVNFTWSFWMRTTTTAKSMVFGSFSDGNTDGFQIQLNTNSSDVLAAGDTRAYVRDEGAGHRGFAFTNAAVYDGAWHHHAWVRELTGTNTLYYVDGVSQSLTVAQNTLGTGELTQQYASAFGARNLRGVIDGHSVCDLAEIALYSDDLAVASIEALASKISPLLIRPDLLLRYWRLINLSGAATEMIAGDGFTENGNPTATDHPPAFYAAAPYTFHVAAAAPPGGDPEAALIGGKLLRGGLLMGRRLVG